MQLSAPRRRQKDSTIALINIVFLMLVFFMIAGNLTAPMNADLKLVSVNVLDGASPPDTLVVDKNGKLFLRDIELTSVAAFMERLSDEDRGAVRVVPDRNLPAKELMQIHAQMREEGAERILVVTERALK